MKVEPRQKKPGKGKSALWAMQLKKGKERAEPQLLEEDSEEEEVESEIEEEMDPRLRQKWAWTRTYLDQGFFFFYTFIVSNFLFFNKFLLHRD